MNPLDAKVMGMREYTNVTEMVMSDVLLIMMAVMAPLRNG